MKKKVNNTVMFVLVTLLILVSNNQQCFSQTSNHSLLTFLNGKSYYTLFNFLVSQGEVKNNHHDSIYTTLESGKLSTDSLQIGIYQFGIPSTHSIFYLYIQNNNNKKFIKNYSTEFILKQMIKFFKRNNKLLSEDIKINYLKKVATFLYYRNLSIKNNRYGRQIFIPDSTNKKNNKHQSTR